MKLRMKNFNVLGVYWINCLLRGSSRKSNIEGKFPKNLGCLEICRDRGGGRLGKKKRVVFLRSSWYPDAHYEQLGSLVKLNITLPVLDLWAIFCLHQNFNIWNCISLSTRTSNNCLCLITKSTMSQSHFSVKVKLKVKQKRQTDKKNWNRHRNTQHLH